MQAHPRVPWIAYRIVGRGLVQLQCQACGAAITTSPPGADGFASQHAQHQSSHSHYGAGDAVAALTGALGLQGCTPCEQRRIALNEWAPRLWRR